MSTEGPAHPSTIGPVALANVQVDLTTRLGAPSEVTPTGFRALDALLGGGLRSGSVLALSGPPGSGRTSLALMIAYMAARTQAGVEFVGRGLDDTEIVARLAARALRRTYPESEVTYADIWSGNAYQNDTVRRAVGEAVDTVLQKVGAHLHITRLGPGDSLETMAPRSTQLWARYDRVLLVVDDLEGMTAGVGIAPLDSRLVTAAYELRSLAEQGCAVVFTVLDKNADLVAPATTAMVELRPASFGPGPVELELAVTKNRLGPTGRIPVRVLFAACEFTDP
jgi:replicative DNA helicase